jgi:hypothetical protein
MVTDTQVRRLKRLSKTEKTQELAAAKAGMDPKTARNYLGDQRLPSGPAYFSNLSAVEIAW